MTHPLRDAANGKRRVKSGEPFDPAELTRRLEAYQEQQRKSRAGRRTSKMEAAATVTAQKQEAYHHVPQVAAASFERTTTQDGLRRIHKLAELARRHHHAEPAEETPSVPVTALQKSQALDQALLKQEALRSRNQFQWTRDMEEAAEVDVERDVYRAPQRTFEPEQKLVLPRKSIRPLSTGDILSEEEGESPPLTTTATRTTKKKMQPFHQNDWAQRDEFKGVDRRRTVRERVNPFLRKKESGWILGGKKEKDKIQKVVSADAGQPDSPVEFEKAGRGRFLARFKRHPS
ncbi:hypothetical protein PVAG01_10788 [Phlyctema vagabunda]|uniref:Uncharacterized protein n=1 Tax=Phlyctema vagabunda TaxID=108571 RepID=A0ABR4P3B1_9HELO